MCAPKTSNDWHGMVNLLYKNYKHNFLKLPKLRSDKQKINVGKVKAKEQVTREP